MFARAGNIAQQITAVRTATKRVSGSKTNKNDSAGRRLGPKAYEGNFVKPGTILMRQRGTKIHPGENTDIGSDHTIYATEPGYVRFYYDPFHPLRKYVGVALKKELALPTPHFAPRVRRFGYQLLTDEAEAAQEQAHMSKKEFDAQPMLKELEHQQDKKRLQVVENVKHDLGKFDFQFNDAKMDIVRSYLALVIAYTELGMLVEDAKIQATFDGIYHHKLVKQDPAGYKAVVSEVDSTIDVDGQGRLCPHLTAEVKQQKQQQVAKELEGYTNKLLTKEDRENIGGLIATPGVFSAAEQQKLKVRYLPDVVSYDVEGSVVEVDGVENTPKGVVVQRVFDEGERKVKVIGRPKDAFA